MNLLEFNYRRLKLAGEFGIYISKEVYRFCFPEEENVILSNTDFKELIYKFSDYDFYADWIEMKLKMIELHPGISKTEIGIN